MCCSCLMSVTFMCKTGTYKQNMTIQVILYHVITWLSRIISSYGPFHVSRLPKSWIRHSWINFWSGSAKKKKKIAFFLWLSKREKKILRDWLLWSEKEKKKSICCHFLIRCVKTTYTAAWTSFLQFTAKVIKCKV